LFCEAFVRRIFFLPSNDRLLVVKQALMFLLLVFLSLERLSELFLGGSTPVG
jgi:hypothetical protein